MTRLECIKSNAFLLGLNMNKATREQKIQWVCQLIKNETDKPMDQRDFALIGECSAYLRELSDKAAEATKEQKQRILQQIKAHHNQIAANITKVFRPTWRKVGKIVAITATVAALVLSSLTVLAKVNGYSSAWEYIAENLQKIIGLDAGDRVNEGNITLIKNNEVVTYDSIEELLVKEELDILYPSELPEGIQITNISQQIISEDHKVYSIHFADIELSIAVSTKINFTQDNLKKCESISTPNMVFYIKKLSNGLYQAIGHDGKYEYIVSISKYDELLEILKGMKGLDQ